MEKDLFEALNSVYTFQVTGQDNGVNTSWVFDNGTQKLGLKMAAIKPGALKKYKPAERVAQFFLFRVTDTGKTGGAPKTIFKPLQTVSTIAHIISLQASENKLNAFVIRFPKGMDGEGLIGLMQRVANKVGSIRFEQQGYYTFEGLQYGYALFVRSGRNIDSFFGKEWTKYTNHQDVLEYASTFNHVNVKLDKLQQKAELLSGIVRSLDKQNTRIGVPAKLDISTIAGGNDIPDNIADFNASEPSIYNRKTQKSFDNVDSDVDEVKPQSEYDRLEAMFGYVLRGASEKYVQGKGYELEQDPQQAEWQRKFEDKKITAETIATGESLEFIREWLTEGFMNNWITEYRKDGKILIDQAVSDACYGYIDNISKKVIRNYKKLESKYIKPSDRDIVIKYTGSEFSDINNALLHGLELENNVSNIKKMDTAFENSGRILPKDVILYRGMSMPSSLFLETIKGKAFHFRTFVSTSFSPRTGLLGFVNTISNSSKENSVHYNMSGIQKAVDNEEIVDDKKTVSVGMVIRDAYKVPVLIPGTVSSYETECEVILSRGTTMKVTDVFVSKDEYKDVAGTLSMSVMGLNEIKLNEVYDGDHFVKTGEIRKMSFSMFVESRKASKKTKERNYNEFYTLAAKGYSRNIKNKILSRKEKEEELRIQQKFGGELISE